MEYVSELEDTINNIEYQKTLHPGFIDSIKENLSALKTKIHNIEAIEKNLTEIRSEILDPVSESLQTGTRFSKLGFRVGLAAIILTIVLFTISASLSYSTKETVKSGVEKLTTPAFLFEKFGWDTIDEFLNKFFTDHKIPQQWHTAYRTSAIQQIAIRLNLKFIYDEYTYHIEIEENDDGSYSIITTGYKDSDSVIRAFEDQKISYDRDFLNKVYNSVNLYGFYSDNVLANNKSIEFSIYRNEKGFLRFVFKSKKQ